ncbi:MAG: branched-chain amino acid ABC transporter permease [Gammaproteobacteria bacterium]|nr:branched-chain amino acid ABC transporter permease [Gammaproteobacteria bacterium]MCZ7659461.1 branched-chain amino acid ABC transporter permease [Xanthobacteraceae bacterium]GIK99954.1 MAG: branched-chain amino acid ABC transporter permease [Alphaproteobacteria bacterium]
MSLLVIGLSISMLLFLLAAGLTVIFGMLGVVNFAHGALYMLGAYTAYQLVVWTDSFWLALVVSPLLVALVGGLIERFTLRPLYDRDHAYQLLMTFACVLVIEEAVRLVWGVNYKAVNAPPSLSGSTELFGSIITDYRLFIIVFGMALSAALFLVIEKTRIGMMVRAASSNSTMAACLGIDVVRLRTIVFMVGTALAAVGGAVAGPLLPLKLGMGYTIIIDCFVIIIIGGLGSIRGAILGSLVIGMTRALGQQFASDWINLLTYLLLILTLVARPEGLFNRRGREA